MDEIYIKLIDVDVVTGNETPTIYPLNVFKNFLELEGFARSDIEKDVQKIIDGNEIFLASEWSVYRAKHSTKEEFLEQSKLSEEKYAEITKNETPEK